jgi:mono/diheme cytochrome c family protein
MTIFFLKSLLALVLLSFAAFGMYTMFEVFGKQPDANRATRFKRFHRYAGYGYLLIFLAITYLCIRFLEASRDEMSSRAALHATLALLILGLLFVKVLFVRRYRQYYMLAKSIGIATGVMTVALVGISAGFYLTVSRFGYDKTTDKSFYYTLRWPYASIERTGVRGIVGIRTDPESIRRGRLLFHARCSACHDPTSTRTIIGPGLKGILKRKTLPVSGHPATAESIRFQLRQPLGRMPSFASLSEEDVADLIAYLNTL